MKDLETILKQEPIYLNNWKENKMIGVISDFEDIYISKSEFEATECPMPSKGYWLEYKAKMTQKLKDYEGVNILFASYGTDNYSGDAFVLFEKDGKLFEVNGGHCSCYGLEEQFEPEETTLEAIEMRLTKGTMGVDDYSGNEFANELKQFLGIE
jgi:hypothetical protein